MERNPLAFAEGQKKKLRAAAAQIEAARGVPSALARELALGGLFQLFTPAWLGGLELSPVAAFRALEETAKGDMSCGWTAMISSTSALGAAWMEREAALELFSHQHLIFAGVAAPTGTAELKGDRLHATGSWQWGSGSNNADYFMGGCMVSRAEGNPSHRMVIFPKEKITLADDWHVMGLQGSASNSVSVAACEVPATHSFSVAGAASEKLNCEGALYQMPFFGMLACGIAACALGNVGGMLEELLELATTKTPAGTKSTLAEKPYVQIGIARATAAVHEARGNFYHTLNDIWDKVQHAGLSFEDRAHLRLASMTATYHAAEIATQLHHLAGGDSVFSHSPLQRRLRDSHIATQHRMVSPANYQIIGQILLGVADKRAVLKAAL